MNGGCGCAKISLLEGSKRWQKVNGVVQGRLHEQISIRTMGSFTLMSAWLPIHVRWC